MAVAAGSAVHTGGGSFSVTGIGFRPQWGIFMATSLTGEGSWQSPTAVVGAIGFSAVQNNELGQLGQHSAGYHEIWENSGVGGIYLGNQPLYLQTARDGAIDGWTAYMSFTADGFDVGSSITGGAAGKRIYYLLGDESWEQVASSGGFIPGSSAITLGWQPQAFFGVGYGGGTGSSDYNAGFTDLSLPTVVAGDWGEYTDFNLSTNGVWRGIRDPDVNTQFWMGNYTNAADIPILNGTVSAGIFFSAVYRAVRTDTTFLGDVTATGGFGDDDARLKNMVLGSVDSVAASFLPSTTVGVPTQVSLPFVPEAVVFFSPGEHDSGIASQVVQGMTGYGWVTDQGDQALAAWGGHWNPPNPFQKTGFQSSSHCWIGNALDADVDGTVGTKVNMGTAEINGAGFTHTTTAHAADPGEVHPVLYWAIAPVVDGPQFFRVIN